MRVSKAVATLLFILFSLCFSSVLATISVVPLWARSTIAGPSNSVFISMAVDSSGNIYAVGYIQGTGTYDFGNGAPGSNRWAVEKGLKR